MNLDRIFAKAASVRMRSFLIGLFLLPLFTCSPVSAAQEPWRSLSHKQQDALAPLAQQWDSLPEAQQHRLLKTAKRYSSLSQEQKQRFHERLTVWSKLTPEQREAAREKYQAFSKVPAEKREQVKQMVKQEQERKAQQAASGVPETAKGDK